MPKVLHAKLNLERLPRKILGCMDHARYWVCWKGELILLLCFTFVFSLEERQRAEKRNREDTSQQFTSRWFDQTDEIHPTPWGDLEVYKYNGKYTEHRAAIDSSGSVEETDIHSMEFNPWQYENLAPEWALLRRSYLYHIFFSPQLFRSCSFHLSMFLKIF